MKKHKITQVSFNLPVSIFLQGNAYVAYTPALDISTYGKSKSEAQENFQEVVDIFFSEFDDARELGEVLESLGWTKDNATWQPPVEIEHTRKSFNVPAALMMA